MQLQHFQFYLKLFPVLVEAEAAEHLRWKPDNSGWKQQKITHSSSPFIWIQPLIFFHHLLPPHHFNFAQIWSTKVDRRAKVEPTNRAQPFQTQSFGDKQAAGWPEERWNQGNFYILKTRRVVVFCWPLTQSGVQSLFVFSSTDTRCLFLVAATQCWSRRKVKSCITDPKSPDDG